MENVFLKVEGLRLREGGGGVERRERKKKNQKFEFRSNLLPDNDGEARRRFDAAIQVSIKRRARHVGEGGRGQLDLFRVIHNPRKGNRPKPICCFTLLERERFFF